MKGRFESAETFEAYATIEAGYYMINKINKEFNVNVPAIIKAVDKATGYEKHRISDTANDIIRIVKDIISAKKVIDADFSADQLLIKNMEKLLI